MTRMKIAIIVPVLAAFVAGGAKLETALAAQDPSAQAQSPSPKLSKEKEKKLAAGEAEAKQLLLLMDRDQNGKISHQEYMTFMEEEFQRLDINKDGELDVNELSQSRLVPHVGVHR